MKQIKQKNNRLVGFLAVLAAVIYSSWIVGYFLDWRVAVYGVASELAASGQDARELYVYGDVLACALILVIGIILLRRSRRKLHQAIAVSYIIFGIGTALAALIPLTCAPSIAICTDDASVVASLWHNLAGMVGTTGMLVAVAGISIYVVPKCKLLRYLLLFWITAGSLTMLLGQSNTENIQLLNATIQRVFLAINAIFIVYVPLALHRTRKNTIAL